eukprot:scaffold867_cov317-Pavlova_lutheri.AAC.28
MESRWRRTGDRSNPFPFPLSPLGVRSMDRPEGTRVCPIQTAPFPFPLLGFDRWTDPKERGSVRSRPPLSPLGVRSMDRPEGTRVCPIQTAPFPFPLLGFDRWTDPKERGSVRSRPPLSPFPTWGSNEGQVCEGGRSQLCGTGGVRFAGKSRHGGGGRWTPRGAGGAPGSVREGRGRTGR